MKLGYFMNAYPMTSTTFIRREIEAHEAAGRPVTRFAVRPWDQGLVDPRDIEEAGITNYILAQGFVAPLVAFLREMLVNPVGVAKGALATVRMMANARGKRLKQLAYLVEAASLKQKAAALGIEHLHTHFSTNSASVALLSHLMGGPPYSMTVHGPDELFEMARNSLGLKVRHATFVAAITNYCRRVVDDHTQSAFSEKIHVVRCGLHVEEFKDYSEVPANKTLVCVGRICKAKAQLLLVETLGALIERHPDVRLVLIGDGEERPAVEQRIAERGIEEYVELAGWKKNEDVRQAIRSARALVLPSLAEGLPIVLMESLALGRPVVTTEIYGIPELVDASCGWLAQPGDKESLLACLDALLSEDPERLSEMALAGRARVLRLHDQAANAETLRNLIDGDCAARAGGST